MRDISVAFAATTLALGLTAVALAQGQRPKEDLKILSGSDLGFRVERIDGGRASGTFIVKIDGQWVEAVPAPKAMAVR